MRELGLLLGAGSFAEAGVIAAQLVELAGGSRGAPALLELARHWSKLPEEAREAVLCTGLGRWGEIAPALLDDPEPEARRAAAMLAATTGEPALIEALPRLLRDEQAAVARAAEAALVRLSRQEGSSKVPAGALDLARRVIAQAAIDYPEHRRSGALLAVGRLIGSTWLLAEAGEPLDSWLAATDHPVHLVMRAVIRRSDDADMRLWSLLWLKLPAVAGACRDRLIRAATTEEHEEVLSRVHLLANPARLAALRRVRMPAKWLKGGGAIPTGRMLRHLTAGSRAGLARWLESVVLPAKLHDQACALLLGDESPFVRHAMARSFSRAVFSGSRARALACPLDLCFDRSERVACTALLALSRDRAALMASPVAGRSVERLRCSPHRRVRQLAAGLAARCCDRWDIEPGTPAGRLGARRLMRANPEQFIARLRHGVTEGPADSRIAAIRVALALGAVEHIELELLRTVRGALKQPAIARSRHEHVVATAAAALGELRCDAAESALRAALEDSDGRVRANAVEALCRRARRAGGGGGGSPSPWLASTLAELRGDAHHRVRAAATCALIGQAAEAGEGAELDAGLQTLVSMIGDERAPHRLAGLWVAERLPEVPAGRLAERWGDHLAGQLAGVIQHDPDPDVRRRATRCAGRFVAAVRRAWTGRAGLSRSSA